LRRLWYLALNLAIIGAVMTAVSPGFIRAETIAASESFDNTNNIDTTNTTANVDTNHTQARLTNTDSWTVAVGIPSSVTLNSVTLISATVGWAVGSSGSIYKTSDGGLTWSAQTSGVSVALNGVSAASSSLAWAVGASGTILATTNGGTTWSAQTSGTANALNGVYAPSTSVVYAVGASGTILKTTDGSTWAAQTSGTSNALNGVFAKTTTLVYTVGASGTILNTTDGSTWAAQTSGTSNTLNAVHASSANAIEATVVGDSGTILTTTSAGGGWIPRTAPANENIKAVSQVTSSNPFYVFIMTTSLGSIFRYADPTSITAVTSNVSVSLNGIAGSPTDTLGIAVGASGTIARNTSADSASAAYQVVSGTGALGLNAGSCASTTTCWSVGDAGVILTSSDNAATWSSQTSGVTGPLRGVKMVSTSVGWAVGDSGTILKTSNGTSWSSQTSGVSTSLRAADAASTSVAWAVGASGTIVKTADGSTWSTQTSGSSDQLNAISAPSTTVAWVAGNSGTVLLTTDGGTIWTAKTTGVAVNLNGIAGIDSSTAYVVGGSGTILKTANGGSTWSTLTSGVSANLTSVAALDTNTIRVTGVGVVRQSIDAGTTWSSIATNTVSSSLTYNGITHPALNAGVILGQGYAILRYIPVYSSSALIAVSQNRNSTSTNIGSATLTATATLNSQTITYALSNDAGTTYNTVTSGTAYTFGTTGADLRWRATLSSTDTTATPVLTAISLSAETTGSSASGGSVADNYNERPADTCTGSSCTARPPWLNPTPTTPTVISPTTIRWNFTNAGKGGARLLKRVPGGSVREFTEIVRVTTPNPTFIEETGLSANSIVSDRLLQYVPTADELKLADADIPRELPTVTLPPATPPAPEPVKLEAGIATVQIRDGGNALPILFAIQDSLSSKWLGEGFTLSLDEPVWKTIAQWSESADGTLRILGLSANTSYAIRVKAKGLKEVQTDFSQSLGFTTALETPSTIVPVTKQETALTIAVKSVREDGQFSNLTQANSGLFIENVTTKQNSGWLQKSEWTIANLRPGKTYEFRVKTRRADGIETPLSPVVAIATAGTNEEELKKAADEKKKAEEEKKQVEQEQKRAAAEERRQADEQRRTEEAKKQPTRRREEPKAEPVPEVLPQIRQETPTFSPELTPPVVLPQLTVPEPVAPTFGGGGTSTTPEFGPPRLPVPLITEFAGIRLEPGQPPIQLAINTRATPELVLSGSAEPNTLIVVVIASEPFTATTTSRTDGLWSMRIATALIPPSPSHTVYLQAKRGEAVSPQLAVATLTISRPPAEVVRDTLLTTSASFAETTLKIVEQTEKVTKQAAVVTAEAVQATKVVVKKAEPQAQVTLTTVVPIVVAFNPPLWALLPQLPVLFTNLITWLLTLLGVRKRRLPWGLVYDAVTKEPIALAIVRVFDAKTNRVVETQVSDRQGRFGVMSVGTSYRLEVTKGGYRFPSQIVRAAEDGLYSNVYRGGEAPVPASGSAVTIAIPIDSEVEKRPSAKQRGKQLIFELRRAFRKISPFLLWTGTASGFILVAASPTTFNTTVSVLYLGLAIIDQLAKPKALRSWGRVVDASSGAPVALAAVDLIDTKYNKLLKSRLTDSDGRFAFLPPPGNYKIQARKEGYALVTASRAIRNVKKLYIGDPITVTEKNPTISVTLALEKTT